MVQYYDETIEMYNAQKESLNNCFDEDYDVLRNINSASGWIGEANEDDFVAAADKTNKVINSFPRHSIPDYRGRY